MILSDRLTRNLSNSNLQPIFVLQIEGIDTLYTSEIIKKKVSYGDPGLEYGDVGLLYGGLSPVGDQETLISIDGTTTQIQQTLDPEKGRGSGITQMKVSLVDKNKKATQLATGQINGEILYRKVKFWVGFNQNSDFNDDFILVFRGIISALNFNQGNVILDLSSVDDKKRQILLPKLDAKTVGAITNSQTTITLSNVENLFLTPDHPAYSPKDTSMLHFILIEDELIQFDGISGNDVTGCLRGQLGTVAIPHDDDQDVSSFHTLQGHTMDLALKIMMSDTDQTPYIEDLAATSAVITDDGNVANAISFTGIDLSKDYNVNIGDYVKTAGWTNGANNFSSYAKILDVIKSDFGSYIVLDSTVSLVSESGTSGTVTFLSFYNSLGFGLGISPEEVDIEKHIFFRNTYLANFNLSFYLRDEIEEGKEWIERELYVPATCYSLPSDQEGLLRVSVGIHKPPLPNQGIVTLDNTNIVKPEALSIMRSSAKYYYNAVLFQYEDVPLSGDKFYRRVFEVSGTAAIPTGNRTRIIKSTGLKDFFNAKTVATLSAQRLLQRYDTAAEYMTKMQVRMAVGIQVAVGDIIILDSTGLNLVDRSDGSRDRPPRMMEVLNKNTDLKTGQVQLDLIDTAFQVDAKYGLVSASSLISSVISQKKFTIAPILAPGKFGAAEYRKWDKLKKPAVKIRNYDFSNVFETVLDVVNFNTLTLRDDVPFTLTGGEFIELANYSNVDTTTQVKLIYAFESDDDNDFPDGEPPYVFT